MTGLVRLCDDNAIVPPGNRVDDVIEPRYAQSARVYVGSQDNPVMDVAFDENGYVYIVPVVVDPYQDEDPDFMYNAAAKLQLDSNNTPPYRIVQLYAPSVDVNDNYISGLREIEVDDDGNVYVLNVHSLNESDALWVYDSDTGSQQKLAYLVDPCDDSNSIYAPVSMCVSSITDQLYLASSLNDPNADSTSLYIISKDDLMEPNGPNNIERISIEGLGHITDITEDPTTGTLWVIGFTMLNIPSLIDDSTYQSMQKPFYEPYLARIPTPCGSCGIVQAEQLSDYSDPAFSLALPLSVVWTGCVDFSDFAGFAQQWQQLDCDDPDWCDGADLNRSGEVDGQDFNFIIQHWLKSCKP
jgi:hypothetical protein